MTTTLIILLLIAAFIIYLYKKGRKDAYKEPEDGTVITYPDKPMFMENDTDDFSPENLDIDKTLKVLALRKKLKNIESKRNDVNIDYTREDGK